jgi:hypothetical protein
MQPVSLLIACIALYTFTDWVKEPLDIQPGVIDNAMRTWPNKLGTLKDRLDIDAAPAYGLFDHVPATATAPGHPPTPDDIGSRARQFNGPTLGFLCSTLDGKVSD